MSTQLLGDQEYCYILSVLYLRWLIAYYCRTSLIYTFMVIGFCKYILFNTSTIYVYSITQESISKLQTLSRRAINILKHNILTHRENKRDCN